MSDFPSIASLLSPGPRPVPGGNSFQRPWSSGKPGSVRLWSNFPLQPGLPPIRLLKRSSKQFLLKGTGLTREGHCLSGLWLGPPWKGKHNRRGTSLLWTRIKTDVQGAGGG